MVGVAGLYWREQQIPREVTNRHGSRKVLERPTIEGDSPVSESVVDFLDRVPKYVGTRGTLTESGRTIFQG